MKIGIVGYGMMGASLHLALLDSTTLSESDTEVRLFVRDTEQQSYLAKRGIRSSTDLGECDGLDLVIICVNLASVEPVMGNLANVAGSFKITDISSVKKRIAATGKRLFGARYTSSHPIAGSDKNGLGTAIDNLFTVSAIYYQCFVVESCIWAVKTSSHLPVVMAAIVMMTAAAFKFKINLQSKLQ